MISRSVRVESLSEWKRVVSVLKKDGYKWIGGDLLEDAHEFAFTEMNGEIIAVLNNELVWGWESDFPYYDSFEDFMKGLK